MGKTPRLRLRGKRYDALPVSAPLPRCAILKSQPLLRLRTRVRELPRPHGLEPEDRVDPRAAALSGYLRLSVRRPPHAGREAVSGLLDDGLSALGPPSDGGHTAADPHRDTLRRTNSEPGWDRRGLQLAHAIRGGGRALALARRSGRPASRVSFARRLDRKSGVEGK